MPRKITGDLTATIPLFPSAYLMAIGYFLTHVTLGTLLWWKGTGIEQEVYSMLAVIVRTLVISITPFLYVDSFVSYLKTKTPLLKKDYIYFLIGTAVIYAVILSFGGVRVILSSTLAAALLPFFGVRF